MKKLSRKGYLIGFILSTLLVGFLIFSDFHSWRTPGPFNTGHENLKCIECHQLAKASIRQQIQANLAYLMGERTTTVAFNFEFPDNKDCLDCHAREDDRHPVYRFNEPRFLKARKKIQAQYCISCHAEHNGVRVSSDPENCKYCHSEIKVKNDPLDISHANLIKLNNWNTCLACHDFHGNHKMKTPTRIDDMLKIKQIKDYFAGGDDPYSNIKTTKARSHRNEN